ncbi:MAG: M20 family metallo-hydrolase [Holophaga sp.]|nr:M20 family metallo-hydrolase [Holophaga sp.]
MTHVESLHCDGKRLLDRLDRLGAVGRQEDGSCCRLAFSDADRQGRDLVVSWMQELGLEVRVDRVGNLFGLRRGSEDLEPVMTGSHIDTVATGGQYDGCLGVLAALEAVHVLNERGIVTRRPLAVAVFSNEEGVRFQPDMAGSLVYAGGMTVAEALAITGIDQTRFGAELERIGYAGPMEPGAIVPHAFVELHIEQGPILDQEGGDLGAVANLQGISWQEVVLRGSANHAGTTPMRLRRDAAYGAARLACFVHDLAWELGGTQLGTVGSIRLQPNLINVIPREAAVTVDLRNTDEQLLRGAEARLEAFLRDLAGSTGLTVETRRLARFEPVVFDPGTVQVIEQAAASLGLPIRRMTSGAGQDAQMLARICPSAMIFVPSIGGISHSPEERTDPRHLQMGADVLLRTLLALSADD